MREYTVREYDEEDYRKVVTEMTDDKIVDLLDLIDRVYLPDFNYSGSENDYESYRLHVAMHMAINKLKGAEENGD